MRELDAASWKNENTLLQTVAPFYCLICKCVTFLSWSTSWLLDIPSYANDIPSAFLGLSGFFSLVLGFCVICSANLPRWRFSGRMWLYVQLRETGVSLHERQLKIVVCWKLTKEIIIIQNPELIQLNRRIFQSCSLLSLENCSLQH